MFPEIETSHIIAFSAGVALFGLLFAIRNRLVDTKTKIVVEHGYAHELISEGGEFVEGTKPILYAVVKNKGSTQRFIEKPGIWLSRKIDGEDLFYPARVDDPNKYPIKLESGAVFRFDLNLRDFQGQIGNRLQDHDRVRFIVSDTMGASYRSKKFRVKEIRGQIDVADKVDQEPER